MIFTTFSIVACDLDEKAWGVAVASKFLACGAVVSWAEASSGAIATQALAKVGFGPEGLSILGNGKSSAQTLHTLLASDPEREDRQVAIVDTTGAVSTHTGSQCYDWAGHKVGTHYTCQGNMLTGPEPLKAMAHSFQHTRGELADRLVAALSAGDAHGGDKRGKQSAAVLVVRPGGGHGGDTDRYIDLRVDDDPEPVRKLLDLVHTHHAIFGAALSEGKTKIENLTATRIQRLLKQDGHYAGPIHGQWDRASKEAFAILLRRVNLDKHWNIVRHSDMLDKNIMNYLQERIDALE